MKKVAQILSLLIGVLFVFMGFVGGIIASGDFIVGTIVTVIGLIFLYLAHKMKKNINSQLLKHRKDQSVNNNQGEILEEVEPLKKETISSSSHFEEEKVSDNPKILNEENNISNETDTTIVDKKVIDETNTPIKEPTYFEKKVANTVYYETFKTVGSTFRNKSELNNAVKYIADDYFGQFYDGMNNKEIAEYMERVYKYQDFYTNSVSIIPEPENEYDRNAVKVLVSDFCIGYIPKNINKQILPFLNDDTLELDLTVKIIGGPYKELDFIEDRVITINDNYGFELTVRIYKKVEE